MATIKRQKSISQGDSLSMEAMQFSNPYSTSLKIDKYRVYLSQGSIPVSRSANPRNLFDDSNSEDKKWLELAIKHLVSVR